MAGYLRNTGDPKLVLATNRDEFYDRQGNPPEFRTDGQIPYLAPEDPRKGGTWIGINQEGLVVALTNRLDENPKPDAPSRGHLVRELLSKCQSRDDGVDHYRSLEPDRYNPHYLFLAGPEGISIFRESPEKKAHKDQENGLFFLENRGGAVLDQDPLRREFDQDFENIKSDSLQRLEQFCESHEGLFDRESACLHAEIAGTLSSSLILIDPGNSSFAYRFVQGLPCENEYRSMDLPEDFSRTLLSRWSNGLGSGISV